MINQCKPSIQDEYIEKYFAEMERDLTATLDAKIHIVLLILLLSLRQSVFSQ